MEVIAKVLNQLHKAQIPHLHMWPNLEQQFQSLISRGQSEPKESILNKSLKVAEQLLATEKEKVLLHGDIHHDNILHSSSRGWLGIDPQPFVGERIYDYANCFFNPDFCPNIVEKISRIDNMAKYFSKVLGEDPKRILQFAFVHGGLSVSWQMDENKDPSRRLRITRLLESVLKL